ncbi:MAG TPA: tetratricopeptide repeat protein [Ktedonobacterales bacterium]|jgi:TolA-binding protein
MEAATQLPQEVVLQEAPPPFASSPTSGGQASPSAAASEVVPTMMMPGAATTTLPDPGELPTLPDPDALLPTDSDITLAADLTIPESTLTIIEGPAATPGIRIPRPRFHRPNLQGATGAALLRWGPWLVLIGGLIALLALSLTTSSWGSIAARDGITLLVAGACAGSFIWLFQRLHHRWTRRRWFILAASLALVGVVGVGFAPMLHSIQGHALENQGNYQRAIEEYAASGEHSPNGQDIARCYLEWGQRDLRAQDNEMAVQHLEAAAETYSATPAATQAREPLGAALLQWGRQLVVEQRYGQAIQQFARLRTRYADTQAAQQAQAAQDEPAAYYAWGQQLQANQQYQQALTQFQAIGKLFPASSYAPQAYNAAANDLYSWGQALTAQAKYAQAIATYQQLIKQYGNSPAAQQAQQALNAPQPVKGRLIFASGPPDAHVTIRLSSTWSTGPNGYVQGGFIYEVRTDANGNFTFPGVALGKYLVDWQQGASFTTLLHQGTYNPVYIANVEPLRGTNLGDVQVES